MVEYTNVDFNLYRIFFSVQKMRRGLHKSVEKISFLVIKKEMLHVYRTMRNFFGSLLIF